MLNNPFRPGFGSWPPSFVGREHVELLFTDGLANGPGSRYHNTLVTGARGLGKTVLLAAFRDIAESQGYLTVAVDANDGMVRRIVRDLLLLEQRLEDTPGWKATKAQAGASVGIASGHVGFTKADPAGDPFADDPMTMLKPLLERVQGKIVESGGAGLLLTVDEMQAAVPAELERLGNDLQHVQEISFAGAALPSIIDMIFNEKGATFFSRIARFELEPLTTAESMEALSPPFDDAGIGYDRNDMVRAADQTRGYPYLVQLLGYELWHRLTDGQSIDADLIDAAYTDAHQQSILDVLQPTWRQLSPSSRRVLAVLAAGEQGRATVREIREKLGKTSSWVSVYRSRLITSGVIRPAGRGVVELAGGDRAAQWIREQLELESP
jgi:hypothetical protein